MTDTNAPEPVAVEEFVEFIGEPPYFVEFITTRAISRKDAKVGWDIVIPEDLTWTKKRGRMLLPKGKVPAEALPFLLEDKAFRVVTE